VNAAAGKSEVDVESFVVEVVNRAMHYSMQTNGVFDCTIEPLMKLWGFRGNTTMKIPSNKEIYAAMDAVGFKNTSVRKNSIGLLHRNSSIDLGGIAVGYTVDRMTAILKQEGIESALINHSGDIFAIGAPHGKNGWEISIPNPADRNETIETVRLSNQAISTSGSYEKFVEYEGERFGHIIDPSTGIPTRKYASISVIADTSLEADIFSTAWFCSEQNTITKQKANKKVLIVDSQSNINWIQ
jgi:thiamine biosynthesis lipoprotein